MLKGGGGVKPSRCMCAGGRRVQVGGWRFCSSGLQCVVFQLAFVTALGWDSFWKWTTGATKLLWRTSYECSQVDQL